MYCIYCGDETKRSFSFVERVDLGGEGGRPSEREKAQTYFVCTYNMYMRA